jgi:hypothetical protein
LNVNRQIVVWNTIFALTNWQEKCDNASIDGRQSPASLKGWSVKSAYPAVIPTRYAVMLDVTNVTLIEEETCSVLVVECGTDIAEIRFILQADMLERLIEQVDKIRDAEQRIPGESCAVCFADNFCTCEKNPTKKP